MLISFLASMCSNVDIQGTPLNERFAATIVMYIWSHYVDAVVLLCVRPAVETLVAASVCEAGVKGKKHIFWHTG